MLGWAEDSETEIVWKQSWVFGVSVNIELLSWCGVLTIFAHHRTPDTKGWLVKHKEFMSFQDFALQSPVSDIDSNKHESCWTEPHDRVLCNGVECNDSATCSHPTERRKMSLSGERKEKDRIKKKCPLKVWSLALYLLFTAKFLYRLKRTYSINIPQSNLPLIQLLFVYRVEESDFQNEDWEQVYADLGTCGMRATRTHASGVHQKEF